MNQPTNKHDHHSTNLSRKEWVIIGLLYLVTTAINIDKAYHIDDTFHLEAVNWIKDHPFHPMSGLINWSENKQPIYAENQPPLYFYLIAPISALFGNGEIILHLFQSIFTFFSLVGFCKITRLLRLEKGLLLTAFFAFCPAFLINQNLMLDVPLLCFNLWFLYYLLQQDVQSETKRYWTVGLILGFSLLIKYSSIPLLVVLLITLLWRKQYHLLYILIIPIGMLGLWSWWNYVEFSAIHLLNRPHKALDFSIFSDNLVAYITCLGAIAPFSLAFVTGYFSKYRLAIIITPLTAFLFLLLTVATAKKRIYILTANDILAVLFLINGLIIISLVLMSAWKRITISHKLVTTDLILLTWIIAMSGFIILFAPFIASRHVLLIVPPALFLGGRWLVPLSILNTSQTLLVAVSICLILAISDWRFANFYRQKATEAAVMLSGQSRVWTVGHWGWQWYAKQQGFREVQADSIKFKRGDYLLAPTGIASQKIPDAIQLKPVSYLTEPFSWLTFLSTNYYNSFYGRGVSWAYSRFPTDTIKIYRVTHVPVTINRLARNKP
jgi:4-amino-4-deoxy-L-arabinose transferase-like glycosyltransferase